MPTYGYRCQTNGHEFETVQGIKDAPLTSCQVCGEPVTRIFYPVGIVFKGPGFYKTDSRGSSSSSSPAPSSGGGTSDSGSGSSSSSSDTGAPGDKAASKTETKKTEKKETRPAGGGETKGST
ncbi:MAG: hypothetical protein NVSMB17_08190 [Candidatus Dormibacteria bacterium]